MCSYREPQMAQDKFGSLPPSPCFSPHFWFISLVGREVVAIETIARVNLHDEHSSLNLTSREK